MGGFYERLIQVVKRVLRKLLRNARLSYEELLTVLTESECAINSRPLTHMTSDEFDGDPLTPSHLLYHIWKEDSVTTRCTAKD